MKLTHLFVFVFLLSSATAQKKNSHVSQQVMKKIYNEIKTPYKYGLVMVPDNNSKMLDSPAIFQKDGKWYMTYIVFDGRGYETWLAVSDDLLHWKTLGTIMSFSGAADWDGNQKAGYPSLINYCWNGDNNIQQYKGRYWLSYLGGQSQGYEEGTLKVGVAYTSDSVNLPHEWHRLLKPVLTPNDNSTRWWEQSTIYKSSIIWDKAKHTGHPFVMYYNAKTDTVERIGMAVSDDMIEWKRYLKEPVMFHSKGITGDAVIQQIGKVYVMFYFGAFWEGRNDAFNRFACSYDLVHWTDWNGEDLIKPSTSYDSLYAHKSWVLKYKDIVYHFYCAVNNKQQRGIAVATSKDIGKSELNFVGE